MVARKRSKKKGGAYSNWGYAQAGNLDEGGGTLSKVEETEENREPREEPIWPREEM